MAEHHLLQPAVGGLHRDAAARGTRRARPTRPDRPARLGERDESLDPLLEKRLDELLLLGEAPVDRADADARRGARSRPSSRRARARRTLARGCEDALPVALGVAAQGALGCAPTVESALMARTYPRNGGVPPVLATLARLCRSPDRTSDPNAKGFDRALMLVAIRRRPRRDHVDPRHDRRQRRDQHARDGRSTRRSRRSSGSSPATRSRSRP